MILKSAREVATTKNDSSPGWFRESKQFLQPLFKKHAKALNYTRQDLISSTQAKILCRSAHKNLQEAITVAKENWTSELVYKIYQMSDFSKDS